MHVCKHLHADFATGADFWRMWWALASVLAFPNAPCGEIGVLHVSRHALPIGAWLLNPK